MKTPPFMSRKEFEKLKKSGGITPDILFPILDYDFCKRVWETSPLIAMLCEVAEREMKK